MQVGARRRGVRVELGAGGLGGEHQAEQLLADHVVQLERQAVALGHDRQLSALLVQPRVGDRDRGVRSEQLDQRLIRLGEGGRASLFGQVEGADDLASRDDRHAQERAHVGMLGGPPAAEPRIVVDVVGPVGRGGGQHRAEHPVSARQGPHLGDQPVAHPRHQEAAEAAVAVGDPERRVVGCGELARGVDEALQHLVHRELGGHGEHGVADRFQRGTQRIGHLAHNRAMPRLWIWAQVAIIVCVAAGIVIAITKLV